MTTILLVEDDDGLAELVLQELEQQGYHMLHAGDGLTALRLCKQQQPDLVILDWVIPALNGLEVLRRMRQDLPIPVLMLTSRAGEADRIVGLELGADDYLTKPFSMGELVARVRALLRRIERVQQIVSQDREKSAGTITYQNLILDLDQHQAVIDGKSVDLTPIEFDLLNLLVRNPGRVFSRAYLLETIWDQAYYEGDRSVDNVVLRLRKKLGEVGKNMETVWGVGYRLEKVAR
jgi:DNA-binding response OmpR family regulator